MSFFRFVFPGNGLLQWELLTSCARWMRIRDRAAVLPACNLTTPFADFQGFGGTFRGHACDGWHHGISGPTSRRGQPQGKSQSVNYAACEAKLPNTCDFKWNARPVSVHFP